MRKPDISAYATFGDITTRLDEIIGQVRDKDTSLERSLDLFDEAIALGSKAVDLVDTTEFSPEEEALLSAAAAAGVETTEAASDDKAEAEAETETAEEGGKNAADETSQEQDA